MGHAAHFLQRLDRVSSEQTELALELYRDHEAVKHMLAGEGRSERIAITLGDERRGPFVIVTRTGHFVTCLGENMSPGPWPVLPRAKVDASLAHTADMRRRRKMAALLLRPNERVGQLVARILRKQNGLSREEILGISAYAPELAKGVYALAAGRAFDLAAFAWQRDDVRTADPHARLTWMSVHALELAGMAGEAVAKEILAMNAGVFSFSSPTTFLVDSSLVLAGIWAAAQIGALLVPDYVRHLSNPTCTSDALDATLALTTIALRHPSERRAIVELLTSVADENAETASLSPRVGFARLALIVLRNADELEQRARTRGAHLFAASARAALEAHDPDYAASAAAVPADLAETAFLRSPASGLGHRSLDLFFALPLLAKVAPGAFHYPQRLVKKLVAPWTAKDVRAHRALLRHPEGKPMPFRRGPRIGRNQPCPCASGKKHKKCCLP